MMVQVVIALFVTAISILSIFILDKLADLDCTKKETDKMLREAVKSLAILIGFGWEKTFDMGVIQITTYKKSETPLPPCISQLIMGICICALVIPAWRIYILPYIVEFDEKAEEQEKEEEEEEEEKKESAAK